MRKQNLLFLLFCSVAGFVLNFIWEWFQCRPFFRHIDSKPTAGSMLVATIGDVALLMIVLMLISLVTRRSSWFFEDFSLHVAVVIVSVSLLLAILVEAFAVGTSRWSYTEANPTVPVLGISILPILQAPIINFVSFWISKQIILAFRKGETQSTEAL